MAEIIFKLIGGLVVIFFISYYDNKEENNQNNYHLIHSVFKISNHSHTNKNQPKNKFLKSFLFFLN